MSPLLAVLIFLAVVLALEGLYMLLAERRSSNRVAARERLRQIALGIQDPTVQDEESILRARQRAGIRWFDLASLFPGGLQLERRLYQAGLTWSPARFITYSVFAGLGATLLAWVFLHPPGHPSLPLLAAGFLPYWFVMTSGAASA